MSGRVPAVHQWVRQLPQGAPNAATREGVKAAGKGYCASKVSGPGPIRMACPLIIEGNLDELAERYVKFQGVPAPALALELCKTAVGTCGADSEAQSASFDRIFQQNPDAQSIDLSEKKDL